MARIGGNQSNDDRHPTDLYPTHPVWTESLLDTVVFRGPIWECANGHGDMTKVLQEYGYDVRATDILTGVDFLVQDERWVGSIVTNPPYRYADEFIFKALELATEQVAMLLPIGALGGQRRYRDLWGKHPPATVVVVAARMPIGSGGASQFNHVWVVWDRRYRGDTVVRWVSGEIVGAGSSRGVSSRCYTPGQY